MNITDIASPLTRVFTTEELAFFNQNGFLHLKHFVDRSTVQTFLYEIQRVESLWFAEKPGRPLGL